MNMIKKKIILPFRLVISFLILYFMITPFVYSDNQNSGKSKFEKAYSLEKEDPHLSIQLYQEAIQEGLEPKLRNTALIRLYFLFLNKRNFIYAYKILNQIPGKQINEKKFFEDLEYFTKLSKSNFLDLYNAIMNNAIEKIKNIYNNSPSEAKYLILNYYSELNKNHTIDELIESEKSDDIENKLFIVNYYMSKEKFKEAEKVLYETSIENQNQLTPNQKKIILNEIAKIKRNTNILESISYFFISANYNQSVEDYERQLSLAIFSIYLSQNYDIAYEFSKFLYYEPRELHQKIFYLLLKAEQNPTKEILYELKKHVYSVDKENFITERAKKLLKKYE